MTFPCAWQDDWMIRAYPPPTPRGRQHLPQMQCNAALICQSFSLLKSTAVISSQCDQMLMQLSGGSTEIWLSRLTN